VIVLTIKSGNMILFDGGIHNLKTLPVLLEKYLHNKNREYSLVLVKADKTVEINTLAQLAGIIKAQGITQIQLAANTRESSL